MGDIKNYFPYHVHTDYSSCVTNIDSATKVQMYVDRAVECGMKTLAFSEHGSVLNWLEKKLAIEKAGMKYVHSIEAYLTESIEEKVRDNYHMVLMARNYDGVKEINRLMTKSFNRENGHFYYVPRILVDDLFNTSDNIIVTSACLASIFGKGSEELKDRLVEWMVKNSHRAFLEIQHHNVQRQIAYNQCLYDLSKKTGLRLIAGTDTHSLNEALAEARVVLQRAKNTFFDGEEGWDLTFKTYDELVEAYRIQDSVPMDVALEAIENTNVVADMIEEFTIDTTPKFPDLYKNVDETFRAEMYKCMDSHPYALKNHTRQELIDRCEWEFPQLKKANMLSFLLFKKSINDWQKQHNIHCGPARGSISGCMIAYLFGITEMDSMKHRLHFFRFCNPYRVSNPDIDEDLYDPDRNAVRKYLLTNPDIQSSEIVAFGTIALKGAIRDVGRALEMPLAEVDKISKTIDSNEEKLRKQYPELFKYVDLLNGVITSVGTHPAGVLCATRPINEEVGLFTLKTTDHPISCLDMYGLDYAMYTKMDELG